MHCYYDHSHKLKIFNLLSQSSKYRLKGISHYARNVCLLNVHPVIWIEGRSSPSFMSVLVLKIKIKQALPFCSSEGFSPLWAQGKEWSWLLTLNHLPSFYYDTKVWLDCFSAMWIPAQTTKMVMPMYVKLISFCKFQNIESFRKWTWIHLSRVK